MKNKDEYVKDNNLNFYLNNLDNPNKPLDIGGAHILEGAHILGRDWKSDKPQDIANSKLKLSQGSGKALYTSISGRHYEGKFGIKNNPYLLLKFLAQNPHAVFGVTDLAKQLKDPRLGAKDALEERRVRDTIQAIRVELKLDKNKKDDFFIVDRKSFGLNCDVELKK